MPAAESRTKAVSKSFSFLILFLVLGPAERTKNDFHPQPWLRQALQMGRTLHYNTAKSSRATKNRKIGWPQRGTKRILSAFFVNFCVPRRSVARRQVPFCGDKLSGSGFGCGCAAPGSPGQPHQGHGKNGPARTRFYFRRGKNIKPEVFIHIRCAGRFLPGLLALRQGRGYQTRAPLRILHDIDRWKLDDFARGRIPGRLDWLFFRRRSSVGKFLQGLLPNLVGGGGILRRDHRRADQDA